ncbi:nuclear transport factor 2 family protein [Flavobacterium sp. LAR06]|uniref:nuclear transport factor 2 family protein n=1 Tax=Flavobacterium sp. LAR06 TaxID=3064897 RepID=UPI0035C05603
MSFENTIKKAYTAFNERTIDNALSTMQPDVQWSKAWEGGYISGHDEIKQYWTRQWTEINPNVEPVGFNERENGSLEVKVHQNVKDLQGNPMFDGLVKHIYTFQDGLIKTMDIELIENN